MDQATVKATFWAAVSAWEEHDFTAYRTHRILLLNMKANARVGRVAFRLHNLLVSYVCFTDKVIPFAAYAMAVACRVFKGLDADATPANPKQAAIDNAHNVALTLLAHGETDAAFDSLCKLEGLRDAYRDLNDDLYQSAEAAHADLLERLRRTPKPVSVPFQGPRPTPTPLLALEGLFTTLSQRLDQLTQVRTDLPDDYLARSKASFTDALLTELERQHYHSPAFDRLITLRDAWDTGQLDVPTVKEQHA
ncbi:hypothetical protein [Marinobacter mangrovi]|uniref:hypothetical protein n=1 Tax=Marinobacter mangrovi TaxID=2803918 RepID=UPI0019322306|nr:hypothetical protein [Marinobacter mangrovi]